MCNARVDCVGQYKGLLYLHQYLVSGGGCNLTNLLVLDRDSDTHIGEQDASSGAWGISRLCTHKA